MKKKKSKVLISLLLTAIMIATCIIPATGVYAATAFKVQFYNPDRTASADQIRTNFRIVNTGTTILDLTKVKLRYYFTDSATSFNFYPDYYSVTNNKYHISAVFETVTGAANANRYMEISLSTGSLAVGAQADIQCRTARKDWVKFIQSDDYSFNASAGSYVDWNKVTGFISTTLYWGIEPVNTTTPTPTAHPDEREIDMLALRNSLKVNITNSDIGLVGFPLDNDWNKSRYMDNNYVENLFDSYVYNNNSVTIYQNKFNIQFEFDAPKSITSVITGIISGSTQSWKLEAANSVEDLKNKGTTYISAVSTRSTWGKVTFGTPIIRKVWRMTTENTDTSNPSKVVNLPDIRFFTVDATSPVMPADSPSISVLDGRTIKLSWQAAQDNVELVCYEVFQSSSPLSSWTSIGRVVGTTFTDTLLTPSTPYYYKVRAIDQCGNTSDYTNLVYGVTSNTMPVKKDYNVLVLYFDPEIPAGNYSYNYLTNKTQMENDTTGTVKPVYEKIDMNIPANVKYSQRYNSGMTLSKLNSELDRYSKYFSEVSGGSVKFNFTEVRQLGINPVNDPEWLNLNTLIEFKERQNADNLYDYEKTYDVTRHSGANYHKLYKDQGILDLVENGDLDFVWVVSSFDNGGFNEGSMAGRGATSANGVTFNNLYSSKKFTTFIGLSYECMGHMTEDMIDAFSSTWEQTNEVYTLNTKDLNSDSWGVTKRTVTDGEYFQMADTFSYYGVAAPGNAQLGNMHNPPNSCRNYGWKATTDSFDKENEYIHLHKSGGTWTWNPTQYNYKAVDNSGQGANSILYDKYWSEEYDLICNDMDYSADVRFDSTNTGATAGLVFRVTKYNTAPGKFNGYYACLDKSRQKVSLYEYNNTSGRITPVKSESSISIVNGTNYNIKVTTDSNNIKVYVDGVIKIDYTHAAYSAAEHYKYVGGVGLRAESATVSFDNVIVDNYVKTYADNWYQYPNYPNTTATPRRIGFQEIGRNEETFHRWWYDHVPKNPGVNSNGILNNWWAYIMDYNHFDSNITNFLLPNSTNKLTLTNFAVPPVSDLFVEYIGASFVKLSWKNPRNTPAYSNIKVFEKTGTDSYSLIGLTNENSYIVKYLDPGTTHTYKICTSDRQGNLSDPVEITVETAADFQKINVNQSSAVVTGSTLGTGTLAACFDGSTVTGTGTANINPAFVQVEFGYRRFIEKARVFLGESGITGDINSWSLEAADTASDLQNKTGSYKLVVPEKTGVNGVWDETMLISNIVDRKIWRFNVKRTSGGNNVNIKELELY